MPDGPLDIPTGPDPEGETLPYPGTPEPGKGGSRTEPAHDGALPFTRLGHYEIVGRIGRGGMGEVYKGYEPALERAVAVKVLPDDLARHPELLRRFHAEAGAAARLVHPHVIPIHFVGEDGGRHFFAMQYVDGESLADRLARRGRLPVPEALAVAEQCLSGLAAAHRAGMVHRDVKPGNILLARPDDHVFLADFGLVKVSGRDTSLTSTGTVLGTVDYLSPEQARGLPVDGRSDLYALGVVLYRMLSGRLPFQADSPTAMLFLHAYEPPAPLREAAPDVPAPLAAVVERLLAKDPADRYPTAEAVLADLRAFREGRPPPASPRQAPRATAAARESRPLRAGSRRLRWWLVGAAAVAVLAAVALGVFFALHRPRAGVMSPGSPAAATPGPADSGLIHTLDHPGPVWHVAFAEGGRLALTACDDGILRLWDLGSGQELRRLRGHNRGVWALAVSPDGHSAASGGDDRTLRLWDLVSDTQTGRGEVGAGVPALAFSPDGRRVLLGGTDGTVRLYHSASVQEVRRFEGHTDQVRGVAFSPDGSQALSGGWDRTVRLWDVDTGGEVRRLEGHTAKVNAVAFLPGGKQALSGCGDGLRVWELSAGREIRHFPQTGADQVLTVSVCPDGRRAVSGSPDRLIQVWDLESGREVRRLTGHADSVESVVVSPDGKRILSGSRDHTARLWEFEGGE